MTMSCGCCRAEEDECCRHAEPPRGGYPTRLTWKYIAKYNIIKGENLYINLACLGVCLFVCLFVSNKRKNGWTDRAQIFCGTSSDPREGLWKIKISNICLHQNSIVIKFLKILKIREIFCENPRIIFGLFYDEHKENMFTTNLEDGHEAPSKASIRKLEIYAHTFY